jgi:hypothetical protein
MTAPPGSQGIRDLHVAVVDGCCVSRWEPTPDELTLLNAGGSVELWVLGGQPPVMLLARLPAQEDGDAEEPSLIDVIGQSKWWMPQKMVVTSVAQIPGWVFVMPGRAGRPFSIA